MAEHLSSRTASWRGRTELETDSSSPVCHVVPCPLQVPFAEQEANGGLDKDVDGQYAQTMQLQWHLVQDQLDGVAREVGTVQRDVSALWAADSRNEARQQELICQLKDMHSENERRQAESEELSQHVMRMRQMLDQEVTPHLRKVKLGLEEERGKRSSAAVQSERRFTDLEAASSLSAQQATNQAFRDRLAETLAHSAATREYVARERQARETMTRVLGEQVEDLGRNLRDELTQLQVEQREAQTHAVFLTESVVGEQAELRGAMRTRLDEQRAFLDGQVATLHGTLDATLAEHRSLVSSEHAASLEAHREPIRSLEAELRRDLSHTANELRSVHREPLRSLEMEVSGELARAVSELREAHCAPLRNLEAELRMQLVHATEQLRRVHIEPLRGLEKMFRGELQGFADSQQRCHEALLYVMGRHKVELESGAGSMRGLLEELEQTLHEKLALSTEQVEARYFEANEAQAKERVAREIQHESTCARLTQEKTQRHTIHASLHERLEILERTSGMLRPEVDVEVRRPLHVAETVAHEFSSSRRRTMSAGPIVRELAPGRGGSTAHGSAYPVSLTASAPAIRAIGAASALPGTALGTAVSPTFCRSALSTVPRLRPGTPPAMARGRPPASPTPVARGLQGEAMTVEVAWMPAAAAAMAEFARTAEDAEAISRTPARYWNGSHQSSMVGLEHVV